MADPFGAFLGQLATGILNPKGNLGDYTHAHKTFLINTARLAPKHKFLYHVAFSFSPKASANMPKFSNKHKAEAGLLVKSCTLPSFTAAVETKKKYNRTKNLQTSVNYNPVTINFHDDNLGIITGMLEAYYRYYFADGHYGNDSLRRAYNKVHSSSPSPSGATTVVSSGESAANGMIGDTTYKGPDANIFKFGLDAGSTDPFFVDIQISQLTRGVYTTYTLVNPIITNWSHGDLNYSDSSPVESSITVNYEAVWFDRGTVQVGANGNPKGFGQVEHYDNVPSPITLAGGQIGDLGTLLGGATDLFDYAFNDGTAFNNPIAAAIAGVNLLGSVRNLSAGDILSQGEGLLEGVLADGASGNLLSGITDISF